MTYLLHIDTSSDVGTVALGKDGVLAALRKTTETRNHASVINLMIADVLAEAGIGIKDLNGIVVCAGPGSYTGLRIGLATAKGLCYATDIPLFLNNKLTLIAYSKYYSTDKKHDNYIAILAAREREYFTGIYNKEFNCTVSPAHIYEDQLVELIKDKKDIMIITDVGSDIINKLFSEDIVIENDPNINIDMWLRYALNDYNSNNNVKLEEAVPFYLKQVYTHK